MMCTDVGCCAGMRDVVHICRMLYGHGMLCRDAGCYTKDTGCCVGMWDTVQGHRMPHRDAGCCVRM